MFTRKILGISSSSTFELLFIGTHRNWSQTLYSWKKWKFLQVFFQGMVSVQKKSKSEKKHKQALKVSLLFYAEVKQLTACVFTIGLGKTASLWPRGTCLSRGANIVNFVSLNNLYSVFILSLVYVSTTSFVLTRNSCSFVKSSYVHATFDQCSAGYCFRVCENK